MFLRWTWVDRRQLTSAMVAAMIGLKYDVFRISRQAEIMTSHNTYICVYMLCRSCKRISSKTNTVRARRAYTGFNWKAGKAEEGERSMRSIWFIPLDIAPFSYLRWIYSPCTSSMNRKALITRRGIKAEEICKRRRHQHIASCIWHTNRVINIYADD